MESYTNVAQAQEAERAKQAELRRQISALTAQLRDVTPPLDTPMKRKLEPKVFAAGTPSPSMSSPEYIVRWRDLVTLLQRSGEWSLDCPLANTAPAFIFHFNQNQLQTSPDHRVYLIYRL